MKERGSEEPAVKKKRRGRHTLVFALTLIAVTTFLCLVSWINGGGILSMLSAITAARAETPSIEIDNNALRFPIMTMIGIVVLGLCWLSDIPTAKRRNQLLMALAIVGGGFVVDELYGELFITRSMASYGYSRCPFLDRAVGNGRSTVWFDGYVRDGLKCLPALNREREATTE